MSCRASDMTTLMASSRVWVRLLSDEGLSSDRTGFSTSNSRACQIWDEGAFFGKVGHYPAFVVIIDVNGGFYTVYVEEGQTRHRIVGAPIAW